MSEHLHYSMTIEWSVEDAVYIVSFPVWEATGHIAHTHGTSSEEAAVRGQEALELLRESAQVIGAALPAPHTFRERQVVSQVSPSRRGGMQPPFRALCQDIRIYLCTVLT